MLVLGPSAVSVPADILAGRLIPPHFFILHALNCPPHLFPLHSPSFSQQLLLVGANCGICRPLHLAPAEQGRVCTPHIAQEVREVRASCKTHPLGMAGAS